jgi:hypothetical protein
LQLSGNVLQHCSASDIHRFSNVVIRSLMSVRPEPESGEQICCLINEVGVVRSQRDRPRPLISCSACSLSSSKVATSQQCGIEVVKLSPRLGHQVTGNAFAA